MKKSLKVSRVAGEFPITLQRCTAGCSVILQVISSREVDGRFYVGKCSHTIFYWSPQELSDGQALYYSNLVPNGRKAD